MSQDSYEAFKRAFPSDELLCELFGVVSYDELFEQHFIQAAELIRKGHVLAVYPSDVAIAQASDSGELISRKGKGRKEIFELDKELYRKSHDLFAQVRDTFHSMFIVAPMMQVRRQDDQPGWDGRVSPVYIFKDGAYGEAVFKFEQPFDPSNTVLRGKLCRELVTALKKHPQETDIWWEYKIEGDSVWLQPKELTEELKAAMQKEYDEERARHWLVMLPFYPGWKPDRSKESKSDWQPATVTRIFDFDDFN